MRAGTVLRASLFLLLSGSTQATQIAPGVDYTVYHLTMSDGQPNVVYVVAIDKNHSEYKWELGWAQKKRNYTARERTSTIASRYNNPPTHPILAAVNGMFFGTVNNPRIVGIGQTDGEMLDVPNFNASYQYQNVIVGPSRAPLVAGNFSTLSGVVTFADGATVPLGSYNWSTAGGYPVPINTAAAFTPQFDAATPAFSTGIPTLARELVLTGVSYPMRSEKEVSGTLSQIITSWPGNNPGNTPIPAGGMVLCGYNVQSVIDAHAHLGQRVRVKPRTTSTDYNNADNTMTGLGWVVHNGAVYSSSWSSLDPGAAAGSRNPRTELAWNASTWFMIVCDGRSVASAGMTFTEMGNFIINTLGGTEAVNYDSGGSSTMVINGVVQNVPSDGSERSVANAILLAKQVTATVFPFSDLFANSGRLAGWDDKFNYADVAAFSPPSPGGDGYVLKIGAPGSTVETVRRGDFADADYSVRSDVYCEYRPEVTGDGRDRCALFLRDSGTGGLGLSTYGAGNCYAMLYDSDTGQARGGKYVNGTFSDLVSPASVTASAWRQFRIDAYGSDIRFWLDTILLGEVTDPTFARGYFGLGYQSFFVTAANVHGTRADNLVAFANGNARPPDMDNDGDVDSTDFGLFQVCFSGSAPQNDPACAAARINADDHVDAADLDLFLKCLSGADLPVDPLCAASP